MDLSPKDTRSTFSVHEARDALGKRLRELRKLAGLTGTQLAESLSWPQSKISKLETARQTPSDDDVRTWTRATGSESHTDELLTALHTLEAQHAEWRRVLRPGLQPHQSRLWELDAKTRLQHYAQEYFLATPRYENATHGTPQQPMFTSTAIVNEEPLGTGTGSSKKAAQQAAALAALATLTSSTQERSPE